MSKFGGRGYGICILFVIIGAILGGILGEVLKNVPSLAGVMPFLVTTSPVFDMAPVTINLYVVKLTVGLAFMPNLMSMLGIILAIVLYRRY
ncbi:DUF4321 domain-containing protein [Mitsuokella multacida]|uniref:DUF4321 domain-containing protein n=1 Tax=Mitsuokella multacida TaxID=52226 RepID=UPI00265E36FA|nr:DUF4321 domain-containing protein [Mitsuokella multacida]